MSQMKISKRVRKDIETKVHKPNLDLMKLLVSEDWFQKLVLEARKIGNIPPKGFKNTEETVKKLSSKRKIFAWRYKLDQDDRKKRAFFSIIYQIEERAFLPEHFRAHILIYILYNRITAPGFNFLIRREYRDLKDKNVVFPYPSRIQFAPLHRAEKTIANQIERWLVTSYPHFLKKRMKAYKEIDRDLKIEKLSKKYKSPYDIVDGIWNDKEIKEDKKRINQIRTSRKRVRDRKKMRGVA